MTVASNPLAFTPDAPQPAPTEVITRPLRIALLGYRSHPFVGGQGIYIRYLSRALEALGHRVDVFSGPPYPELDKGVGLIKVPSLDLYAHPNHVRALRPRHLRSFSDTFEWWTMLTGGFAEPYTFGRRLLRVLQPEHYDVVHDNQSLNTGLLALQNRGVPVTTTIHHPIHRDRELALAEVTRWGDRLLIKRWYSFLRMQEKVVANLHHVTTVSTTSQQDIARYFGRPAAQTPVIPNGVDTDVFRPRPEIAHIPGRILTTTSSDQALKGLHLLLEAVKDLRPVYPDIHLRVIGKLDPDGANASRIKAWGLERHVSTVSGISTEALTKEYASAEIVVCPSLYEGFGLPVIEAMACGAAVISSDGGALAEVVGHGGKLVKAGDIDALRSAIGQALNAPDQLASMRSRARHYVMDRFCWRKVAQALTQHYREIIRDHR